MKKALVLLVVAISVLLVVSALAEGQGMGQGNPGKIGAAIKEWREKIKDVVQQHNCSSETGLERVQCRKERREEIRREIRNCTNVNQTVRECIRERREGRWQNRLETLEQKCEENVTSACRRRLNAVKECINETPGLARAECARNKLRLGKVVSVLVRECRNETNKTSCIQDVKERVYEYVEIKLQDLADRAENLIGLGVDESIVNGFVAYVEDSIVAFNEAGTIPEKKEVIQGVRQAWRELIQVAKNAI
jgi:hypothetical protein